MNKKVLLIALALVVAFAGSAMAAVNFGGSFTVKMEADSLLLDEGFVLTPSAGVTISASNKSETEEEVLNWDFTARLGAADLKLGDRYKLSLYDQYFTLHFWGGAQVLSFKQTPFALIMAHRAADTNRARLIVPVVDVAELTLDFDPKDNLKAFVDVEVEGVDVGLAYALDGWTEDEPGHTVGVYALGAAEGFNLKADAAVKLGDELGFGVGLGADTEIGEGQEVAASAVFKNTVWNDDKNSLALSASYTDANLNVSVAPSFTFAEGEDSGNEITANVKYRMGGAVGYLYLFNRNPLAGPTYYNLDAPAFGVGVAFEDLEFGNVTVDAAAPVVEDMAWVHAKGTFADKDDFGVDVEGYVLATDKLTLRPLAAYASEGKKITAQLGASYKIGLSDTTLGLTVMKVFAEDEADEEELLSASVTVPF